LVASLRNVRTIADGDILPQLARVKRRRTQPTSRSTMAAPEMNSAPDRKRYARLASLTLLWCLGACAVSNAGDLKSFTTDGCSAFPDGTPVARTAWLNCCIRHDLSYWKGGTSDERVDADRALEKCVADIGESEIARLMLAGVRAGGGPYFPTPYRWGYGWPYPRGYLALTDDERAQVQRQLEALELLLNSVIKEITRPNK